jgi:hypothetical protein
MRDANANLEAVSDAQMKEPAFAGSFVQPMTTLQPPSAV